MKDRLSTHFHREEFACRCGCGQDTVDAKLLTILQWLRWETKAAICVTSGNRCKEYNLLINGAQRSQHLLSKAADIVVVGWETLDIYNLLDKHFPNTLGLICYKEKSFVHIDSRNTPYRNIR